MVIDKIKKVTVIDNKANTKASDMMVGKWIKCDNCKEILYKENSQDCFFVFLLASVLQRGEFPGKRHCMEFYQCEKTNCTGISFGKRNVSYVVSAHAGGAVSSDAVLKILCGGEEKMYVVLRTGLWLFHPAADGFEI